MIAVHVDVGPIEMVVRKKFHKLTISIVISINPPPPPPIVPRWGYEFACKSEGIYNIDFMGGDRHVY